MNARLTSDEVMAQLLAIEQGDVTLACDEHPGSIYAGDVKYACSNGWAIVVFCDSGDWDYLDSATAPDGRVWDFNDGVGEHAQPDGQSQLASQYRPSDRVSAGIYGMPGYQVEGRHKGPWSNVGAVSVASRLKRWLAE